MSCDEVKADRALAVVLVFACAVLIWIVHDSVVAWRPASPTPPGGARGGPAPDVFAVRMPHAPRVDARVSEWPAGTRPVSFGAADVSYQPHLTRDNDDLSGSIRVGWTVEVLFLAVTVRDDRSVGEGSVWRSDHVELFLDTAYRDGVKGGYGTGQFQIGLALSGKVEFGHPDGLKPDGVLCKGWQTEEGWSLEAAIPWRLLNVTPGKGAVMGVDICISDSDTPGSQDSVTSLRAGVWAPRDRARLVRLVLE